MNEFEEIAVRHRPYIFKWRLDFFKVLRENDKFWYSPTFDFWGGKWCFCICKEEDASGEATGWLIFYLMREKSDTALELPVSFTLGLKGEDGTLRELSGTHCFTNSEYALRWAYILQKVEMVRENSELCPNYMITVYCDLHIKEKRSAEAVLLTIRRKDVMSQDFKNLFLSGVNSDVTIKVKNSNFCVHSQIISARSPVFAAMLKEQMKKTGTIDIPDCDPGAFKVLLTFLYSGQPDGLSAVNAIHVYLAADKYNIMSLKKRCVVFMCRNMLEEDVLDILSHAIMHNDGELLAHGRKIFLKNAEKLFHTIKRTSFFKEHSVEANELIIKANELIIKANELIIKANELINEALKDKETTSGSHNFYFEDLI